MYVAPLVEKVMMLIKHRAECEKSFWLYDVLLEDFIWLFSSAETFLALCSCSPGPNLIYFSMPHVEKSILVFAYPVIYAFILEK